MPKKIDKKIIDATNCEKAFECLNNQENLCKISYSVSGKVHFLECDEIACKFKSTFGDTSFCSCPVRMEIYNKYKV